MGIAPGKTMIKDENLSLNYYFQAGIWLGHFHSLSIQNNKVKAFGDYSLSNIFISKNKKQITALDPSSKGMSDKNYTFDILTFFKVAYIHKLKNNIFYNNKCIVAFLDGYTKFNLFEFNNSIYKEDSSFILKDFKNSLLKRYSKEKT